MPPADTVGSYMEARRDILTLCSMLKEYSSNSEQSSESDSPEAPSPIFRNYSEKSLNSLVIENVRLKSELRKCKGDGNFDSSLLI